MAVAAPPVVMNAVIVSAFPTLESVDHTPATALPEADNWYPMAGPFAVPGTPGALAPVVRGDATVNPDPEPAVPMPETRRYPAVGVIFPEEPVVVVFPASE